MAALQAQLGDQAEQHQQEQHQHDADQEPGAGRRRAGEHREAEQAGHRGDDEEDEDPFDHGSTPAEDSVRWQRRHQR